MTRPLLHDQRSKLGQTVQRLLDLSQAQAPETFLGSEEELLQKLEVSRPTLRQAARVLQNDGMLRVRRGKKGGYYAARPAAREVLRNVARYLQQEGATLAEVYEVNRSILEDISASAAGCTDEELRARLAALRERINELRSPTDFILAEVELVRLLGAMCRNSVARLFMEIGYEFGLESEQTAFFRFEADRQQARDLQRGLCDAVLAGDAEVARLMSQRRSKVMWEWLLREQRLREVGG